MLKNIYLHALSGHPEIIIRTGGYKRLSDFLLWQAAYSELFFEKKLWPDFKVVDLKNILKKFYKNKKKLREMINNFLKRILSIFFLAPIFIFCVLKGGVEFNLFILLLFVHNFYF